MTPEQKRIAELERQLAMQRDAMDAIGYAIGGEVSGAIAALQDAIQQGDDIGWYVDQMVEKLDDMKENTL